VCIDVTLSRIFIKRFPAIKGTSPTKVKVMIVQELKSENASIFLGLIFSPYTGYKRFPCKF